MDLEKFGKMYAELEEKAYEIMMIYGMSDYTLNGISVENLRGKLIFNINMGIYYSGCGTEDETLSFDLVDMNNDISYFNDIRLNEIESEKERLKLLKEKEVLDEKLRKEIKDKSEYERLRKKFEINN